MQEQTSVPAYQMTSLVLSVHFCPTSSMITWKHNLYWKINFLQDVYVIHM